jgi:hypothetical protein
MGIHTWEERDDLPEEGRDAGVVGRREVAK